MGYRKNYLIRIGTRNWAADFELRNNTIESEIMLKYKEIVTRELSPEEAAELLNARIIDVRYGRSKLDPKEFDEVHYRWDAIKYVKGKKVLYQRFGEEKVFDANTNQIF